MPSQRLSTTSVKRASGGGWPSGSHYDSAPAVMVAFWALTVPTQLPMVELHFFPMRPGEVEAEVLSGRYDLCL